MAHEVETMVSARVAPWHYAQTKAFTQISEDVLTAAEAIKLGGLDWLVGLEEMQLTDGTPVPGRFAVVRDKDRSVLGTVGGRYVPVQNVEAFEFADALVDSGDAKYETAGSLQGGKQIFLCMKLPDGIEVADGDTVDKYLVLTTSHDGTRAVTVLLTLVRVVCMNTLTMALNGAQHRWSVPHTTSLEGRIHEARETLGLTFSYCDEFQQLAQAMIETEVSDAKFKRMLLKVIPERPRTEQVVDSIILRRQTTPTIADDLRGTGWGAYNALTEHFDWGRPGARKGEAQLTNALTGWNYKMRNRMGAMLAAAV